MAHRAMEQAGYQVLRRIGLGGMAEVFLAQSLRTGQRVAIKTIAPDLAQDERVAQRFQKEAEAAMRISHPNVIRIFEVGHLEDGTLFQVMEYLRGLRLTDLLEARGSMSAWQLQPYVHQICMGLHAAHLVGVVHRDLKPDNIFVLEDRPLALKLMDFGVAKLSASRSGEPDVTVAGAILGTPLYIAPEQALGRRDLVGPQTDIYSLGVMLYQALCGELPFYHDSPGPLVLMHVEDAPPPLRERAPDVPPGVAKLVHACLAKEPSRRPSTALQVAVTFAGALDESSAQGQADDDKTAVDARPLAAEQTEDEHTVVDGELLVPDTDEMPSMPEVEDDLTLVDRGPLDESPTLPYGEDRSRSTSTEPRREPSRPLPRRRRK